MSCLTQCTTCHTIFRVAKSDLVRSGGHAKCGVCGMVFNALEAQITLDNPVTNDALEHNASSDHIGIDPSATYPIAGEIQTDSDKAESTAFTEVEPTLTVNQNDLLTHIPDQETLSLEMPATEQVPDSNQSEDAVLAYNTDEGEVKVTTPTDFQPKRKSSWLAATSAVLILVLCGQIAWSLRDALAVRYPEFTPLLNQLCVSTNCHETLSHDIDALKISSSVFSVDKEHDQLFHVQLSLLNQSDLSVAFPAISLSLKNESDETLSRRTIYPMDYLTFKKTLNQGIPAQQEWPITLDLTTASKGVSNYKMLLFYPAQTK